MVLLDILIEHLCHLLLVLYHPSHCLKQGILAAERNLKFWAILDLFLGLLQLLLFCLLLLHFHGIDSRNSLVVGGAVKGGVRVDMLVLIIINKLLQIAWNFTWDWEPDFRLFDNMETEDPLVPLQEPLPAFLVHLSLLAELPNLVKTVLVKAAGLQDYACL